MMEIKGHEGCFGISVEIGGQMSETVDMKRLKDVLCRCVRKVKRHEDAQSILVNILTVIGSYTNDKDPCSDCGAWGGEYVLKLRKNKND